MARLQYSRTTITSPCVWHPWAENVPSNATVSRAPIYSPWMVNSKTNPNHSTRRQLTVGPGLGKKLGMAPTVDHDCTSSEKYD